MTCQSLAHWASENEKLLAQKENLLVLDDSMTLFEPCWPISTFRLSSSLKNYYPYPHLRRTIKNSKEASLRVIFTSPSKFHLLLYFWMCISMLRVSEHKLKFSVDMGVLTKVSKSTKYGTVEPHKLVVWNLRYVWMFIIFKINSNWMSAESAEVSFYYSTTWAYNIYSWICSPFNIFTMHKWRGCKATTCTRPNHSVLFDCGSTQQHN